MNERDLSLDIAKGIGMVLVIAGHLFISGYLHIKSVIFAFHMPLFFILAGYFSNISDISVLIKSSVRRLLLPYIFNGLVIAGFLVAVAQYGDAINKMMALVLPRGFSSKLIDFRFDCVIGATWFLIALFWTRLAFNFILKITPRRWTEIKKLVFILIASFLLSIGVIYMANNYTLLPFGIMEGLQGCVFIAIGYVSRRITIHYNQIHLAIAAFFILALAIRFAKLDMAPILYQRPVLAILGGCAGTYLICALSKHMYRVLPVNISNAFAVLGKESLFVLCVHNFCFIPQLYYHMGAFQGLLFHATTIVIVLTIKYIYEK